MREPENSCKTALKGSFLKWLIGNLVRGAVPVDGIQFARSERCPSRPEDSRRRCSEQ